MDINDGSIIEIDVNLKGMVPREERLKMTKYAKNVHERYIEDEEPIGVGGDGSGNLTFEGVPQKERFKMTKYAKNVHERYIEDEGCGGGSLKVDVLNQKELDFLWTAMTDMIIDRRIVGDCDSYNSDDGNNGMGGGKIDEKHIEKSDGGYKSGEGSSHGGNLKGSEMEKMNPPGYGYPFRYR